MDQRLLLPGPEGRLIASCLFPVPELDEATLRRASDSDEGLDAFGLLSDPSLRHLLGETRDYIARFAIFCFFFFLWLFFLIIMCFAARILTKCLVP